MGKRLILGFGNPGRLDDGLGPAFVKALEERIPADTDLEADYQLTLEDAALVARYEQVVFVDAGVETGEPYTFQPVMPAETGVGFSSHSFSPEAVMALAHNLFGAETEGFLLTIRGYEFNQFGERLSERAVHNLQAALSLAEKWPAGGQNLAEL